MSRVRSYYCIAAVNLSILLAFIGVILIAATAGTRAGYEELIYPQNFSCFFRISNTSPLVHSTEPLGKVAVISNCTEDELFVVVYRRAGGGPSGSKVITNKDVILKISAHSGEIAIADSILVGHDTVATIVGGAICGSSLLPLLILWMCRKRLGEPRYDLGRHIPMRIRTEG